MIKISTIVTESKQSRSSKNNHIQNRLVPKTEEEASRMIKDARNKNTKIIPTGGGTILRLLNNNSTSISSKYFDKLVFFEAEETVVRVGAGMTVNKLQAILKKEHQTLAFDPPNFNNLFLGKDNKAEPTIGGIIASGFSGPNSINLGNVRDHLLGCRFINGKGEVIKTGSRVIKNVTGYDITKLMCASWGRLGFLSEVTLRTVALSKTCTTLILQLDSLNALSLISKLMSSPNSPSATTWLNKIVSSNVLNQEPTLAIRYSGTERHNSHCLKTAITLAKEQSPNLSYKVISDDEVFWDKLRNLSSFSNFDDQFALWRISLPISETLNFLGAYNIDNNTPFIIDNAGTRIWLVTGPNISDHIALRNILKTATNNEGQAFLLRKARYPKLTSSSVHPPVFHPMDENVSFLASRVHHAFDPHNVFAKIE